MSDLAKQRKSKNNQFRNSLVATLLTISALVALGFVTLKPQEFGVMQTIAVIVSIVILIVVSYSIIQRFLDYSLRTKLIISFLLVTLLPLMFLSLLNNRSTRAALTLNANQKLLAAASETAVVVDSFLQNEMQTIREEADLLDFEGNIVTIEDMVNDPETAEEILVHLDAYRDRSPLNINSYAILDLNGQSILEVPRINEKEDESAQSYFITPLETEQPYVSPVQFSESGEAFLYFSSVIRNSEGDVIGILRARHKAAVLQELVAKSTGLAGGQSFAVLFDENHLHLAHGTAPETIYQFVVPLDTAKADALRLAQRLPDLPMDEMSTNLPELAEKLDNALSNPFFEAGDVATGEIVNQTAVSQLDTQPWQVAFFQPQRVFLAPVVVQVRNTLFITILITLLVVLLAIFLSQMLARPIVQLNRIAAKAAQGDLTLTADIRTDDEIGALAVSFNSMTRQLQDLIANLEQRVMVRTRALATSSEVGRQLSTILDQKQLVTEVVTQVRDAFDYYHAHIYLIDETDENILRMVGGTGDAGQAMLANGHYLNVGQGLVGRAAEANAPVLVPDVSEEPDWLPNPLLPETQAEIAVPITLRNRVLGVLDVQHSIVQGLSQEDADLLSSIANQTAIALENARLLTQTQAALAETNEQAHRLTLLNQLTEEISRMETLDDIVAVLMQSVPEMIDAVRISLHLIDEDDATMLRVAGVFGEVADVGVNERIPLEGSPMADALQKQQLVSGTFDTDKELLNAYFAPLYASGRPIGTFNIALTAGNEFEEGERQLLLQLASVLGTTIENRTLFNQTRDRADREQIINNITRKIQGTVTMESALQTAIQELGQALQAGYADVQLKSASKNGK